MRCQKNGNKGLYVFENIFFFSVYFIFGDLISKKILSCLYLYNYFFEECYMYILDLIYG